MQEAHSDGRLDFQELDERLSQIYAAKTDLELRSATADLEPISRERTKAEMTIRATHSSQRRDGPWNVPARVKAAVVHSSVRLDFTDAVVRGPEVNVDADLTHSSLVMIVPPGWSVTVDDIETVGSSVTNKVTQPAAGAVHLIVTGSTKYSSVVIRHPRERHWWWPWYRK